MDPSITSTQALVSFGWKNSASSTYTQTSAAINAYFFYKEVTVLQNKKKLGTKLTTLTSQLPDSNLDSDGDFFKVEMTLSFQWLYVYSNNFVGCIKVPSFVPVNQLTEIYWWNCKFAFICSSQCRLYLEFQLDIWIKLDVCVFNPSQYLAAVPKSLKIDLIYLETKEHWLKGMVRYNRPHIIKQFLFKLAKF